MASLVQGNFGEGHLHLTRRVIMFHSSTIDLSDATIHAPRAETSATEEGAGAGAGAVKKGYRIVNDKGRPLSASMRPRMALKGRV